MSREAMQQALEALKDAADAIAGRLENPATAMHNALIAESALRFALESQQEPQPVAWAIFTPAGNARLWATKQEHLQRLADAEGLTLTPLYAAPQPASAQGWVPAPPKATIQMLVAGRLALYHASMHDIEASETEMAEAWEAMMAARPQPKETT
jgi:hypothetical protein